jgi:1,4-dihydroxy-2-naphthoyl-CoA hydrolase
MAIWFKPYTLADIAGTMPRGGMGDHIGIQLTELGDDFLRGTLPVDDRTRQPFGILHGGASVALAETLGSVASNLCLDLEKQMCVGLEINANHVRAVRAPSLVTGTARALHIGGSTHVWDIQITDPAGRLACVSRFTAAVIARRT